MKVLGAVPAMLLSENCAVSGVPIDTHVFPVLRRGKPPKRLPEARKWGKRTYGAVKPTTNDHMTGGDQ